MTKPESPKIIGGGHLLEFFKFPFRFRLWAKRASCFKAQNA